MRCRLQEKSYDQLSIAIETALRAKFPHNRGWGVKVFPVIESKEGNRSQNILISNDGLYVSRAASFYWSVVKGEQPNTKRDDCDCFNRYSFKLVRGYIAGSKPGMVKKRAKSDRIELDEHGKPIMIEGNVSMSDSEVSTRFEAVRSSLIELVPELEQVLNQHVECSFNPRNEKPVSPNYVPARPVPFKGRLLRQPFLWANYL